MAILVIHGGAGGDGPWLGKTPLDPARIGLHEKSPNEDRTDARK